MEVFYKLSFHQSLSLLPSPASSVLGKFSFRHDKNTNVRLRHRKGKEKTQKHKKKIQKKEIKGVEPHFHCPLKVCINNHVIYHHDNVPKEYKLSLSFSLSSLLQILNYKWFLWT